MSIATQNSEAQSVRAWLGWRQETAEARAEIGNDLDAEAAEALGLSLGDLIARQAREAALATLSGDTAVQVVIFDGKGNDVGHAG